MKSLADPYRAPDMSSFVQARLAYLKIFNEVMKGKKLDALVFPQMYEDIPRIGQPGEIGATTVSEINIAGLPGVNVPAGYYASGAPFSIIFVGRLFDEAALLGLAYDYEQAFHMRKTPDLMENPGRQ